MDTHETHETIADIIAEIRALSNPISDGIIAINGRRIADQLEAAHRRELSKNVSKNGADFGQLGDAAKLREAVEHLLHGEYRDRCEVTNIAHSALAAPPRNCDLAQDWIRDIYAHFQPPASVKREMPPEWVDAVMAFCRWLVAPATEKEGGVE